MFLAQSLVLLLSTCLVIQDDAEIAAIVDGYSITQHRVDRFLAQKLGSNKLTEPARKVAHREATEHLVNRHIVLSKISSDGAEIGQGQIAFEFSKLKDRLAEIDKKLSDYLSENKLTQSELEYEFQWRLAWQKYLKQQLTDERLDAFYRTYKRKYDGTKIQVAHILFPNQGDTPKEAESVKEQIESGVISWRNAAAKYSIARSSASNDGEIGWISYSGPMVPAFNDVAIKLQPGQISDPVTTKFGVHLIKCLNVKPGKIGPGDAREIVRADAARFLFDSISERNRKRSTVELFTSD